MGREVRMVPPNWDHPKVERPNHRLGIMEMEYQPMYDQDVDSAFAKWQADYAKWLAGEHDRVIAEYGNKDYPKSEPYRSFCAWHGGLPEPEYYHPKWPEGSATWFQVYATVSEGTPVTPPFATEEELIEYLVANGDFWDQDRRKRGASISCDPWDRKAAEQFVRGKWSPSMMVVSQGNETVEIRMPQDGMPG